jgi:hypothetical protein
MFIRFGGSTFQSSYEKGAAIITGAWSAAGALGQAVVAMAPTYTRSCVINDNGRKICRKILAEVQHSTGTEALRGGMLAGTAVASTFLSYKLIDAANRGSAECAKALGFKSAPILPKGPTAVVLAALVTTAANKMLEEHMTEMCVEYSFSGTATIALWNPLLVSIVSNLGYIAINKLLASLPQQGTSAFVLPLAGTVLSESGPQEHATENLALPTASEEVNRGDNLASQIEGFPVIPAEHPTNIASEPSSPTAVDKD